MQVIIETWTGSEIEIIQKKMNYLKMIYLLIHLY